MWLARGAPLGCAACFGGKAAPQAGGDEEEAGVERALPSFAPAHNMSAPRPAPPRPAPPRPAPPRPAPRCARERTARAPGAAPHPARGVRVRVRVHLRPKA